MSSERATMPTLGIEIEVPWQAMLRRIDPTAARLLAESPRGFYSIKDQKQRARIQVAMDTVDDRYLGKVDEAIAAGIPKSGKDGYVEFAFQPHDNTDAIMKDVQTLYDLDLLRDGERYPLHVTIGGIAARSSVSYLLCSAEIAGDTRPERILQRGTWSMKCQGGMKERRRDELQLGASSGVEFRTLEHTSIEQLERILSVSHTGAKAINDDHELWRSWRESLGSHLRDAGLPIVSLWSNSDRTIWESYAAALRNNDWRHEANRIIGRHVALLELVA